MRLTPRSPLASLGSLAALSLALSACADPLAPNAGLASSPTPSFDLSAAATTTISSGDYTVLVCPLATAFSATDNTGCTEAFEVSTNDRWSIIPGTTWISNNPDGNQFYSTPQQNYYYKLVFDLPAGSTGASIDFDVFSDNAATVYLNGNEFGAQTQGDYYPNYGCTFPTEPADACTSFGPPSSFSTSSNFMEKNVLTIKVLNATYVESCAIAAPGDPLCESATGVNFTALVNYTPPGNQGCSLGFWKNKGARDGLYNTTTKISAVFASAPASIANKSLLEGLNLGGGGINALTRQAVAAYLNSLNVNYPLSTQQVVDAVNAAYASGNYNTLASQLDTYNNLHNAPICPD